MSTRTVSVVIPVWNAARFVGRAIASAVAGPDAGGAQVVEILAVDDLSTDGSRAVLQRLAAAEPRLKVLCNTANLGPGGSRNAGIAAARGEWIAVLDADDAYAPGRLSRLISVAEENGLDIIADLPVLYDLAAQAPAPVQLPASGRVQRLTLADLLRPDPETGLDLGLLKPVFRRRLADEGLWRYPADVRHGEDFALYFDLVAGGAVFGLLHEAHYVFSTRIGGVSGSYSPGSVTTVDYRAIAAHAEALARRYAARPDASPEVQALLADRSVRALRQNRIHGWTLLRKREVTRLGRWLLQDRRNPGEMLRMIGAKIGGQRGLPE
jgi:succinoglycan biosynthesis protein ExoO